MLLSPLLRHLMRRGTLRVIDADNQLHVFAGQEPWKTVTIRLRDHAVPRQLLLHGQLKLGEAFMDGRLTVEDASLYDLLELVGCNMELAPPHPIMRVVDLAGRWLRIFQQYNPLWKSRQNVAHHYDLSDTLYNLFLDTDRQYSCAYFYDPSDPLEEAQANKKRHLAAKLRLEPGQKVLDIGCGWGGLALYLAQEADVEVTGITLSVEQLRVAERRAQAMGVSDRVKFELIDYRELTGRRFDRIVSVGMFEHVGVIHYPAFFTKIKELLTDDGIALIHSIGRADGPGHTNAWIRKYIFPGGYSPAISEVVPVVEKARMWITDIEVLRLHYAETLKNWRARFIAHRERVKTIYDERFCRMWEFYLAASEVAFRYQGHINFQMQIANRVDSVPLTRDYMFDWERAHTPKAKSKVHAA
ncbi:MAG TPA: cyclopropane-fatty-acyl-phospholipid synthase family protein [Stellaceae bacterium]|jgi:cyclopropane-fatty-acyl-phospholipid synthase|nr:cyclopropane-fatty-acyl-phospholipid synthase family protein [Stellaceae bacterium]